ncbi:MAG: DUF1405 domain-containing protein [Candidatus Hodarchaeota archaeon]
MKEFLNAEFDWLINLELKLLRSKILITILVVGNFLGALIGFLYYLEVIEFTSLYHPIFWIFVPDCPMAAFLLIGFYLQRENQKFGNYNFFVYIQAIRGAMITYLIVFNFPSIDIEIVLIGHTLLIIQSLAIVPFFSNMKIGKGTIIAIIITIFNDFTDFFGLFHFASPTLAQYSTLEPLLSTFVTIIYGLDIILILFGLGIAKYFGKKNLERKEDDKTEI